MCTVEWKIDPLLKYAPLDSMVTYAEMRKEKPDLICLFYEDHLKIIWIIVSKIQIQIV